MNIEKIGASISLLANLSVLVGIVFLAVEISQNTNMMRSQTRDSIAEKQVEYFFTLGSNIETPEIFSKAANGYSELSEAESIAFFYLNQGIFRIWENEYYQFQSGLFDESEFEPRLTAWTAGIQNNEGTRAIWEGTRESYSPEFVELVNTLIE